MANPSEPHHWVISEPNLAGCGSSESKPLSLPIIQPPDDASSRPWKNYPYKPLRTATSIRILRLEVLRELKSGADLVAGPIRGSIVTRDLRDSPHYVALSYTWGDPLTLYEGIPDVRSEEDWAAPGFEITCDNQQVSVTTNLYTALVSLRARWASVSGYYDYSGDSFSGSLQRYVYDPSGSMPWPPRTCDVWIDAICINQNDQAERSAQVNIMGRIFSQASTVLAWLGGEDPNSRSALQTLKAFQGKPSHTRDGKKALLSNITSESWIRLYAFINRSWFKRAWIIQEAILARKIIFLCGLWFAGPVAFFNPIYFFTSSAHNNDLILQAEAQVLGYPDERYLKAPLEHSEERVAVTLYRPRETPPYDIHIFMQMMLSHKEIFSDGAFEGNEKCLGTAVDTFRSTVASDPRDKIYAFLGIAERFLASQNRPPHVRLPVPDYTNSTSQVYTEAMQYMLRSSDNLLYLGLKESRNEKLGGYLPSWVPDFSAVNPPGFFASPGSEPWAAFGSVRSGRFRLLDARSLGVSGQRVGFAAHVASGEYSPEALPEVISLLEHLPEQSEIAVPTLTLPIIRFHNYPLKGSPQERETIKARLRGLRDTHTGRLTLQSRFEVLWRTLIYDKWLGVNLESLWRSYPASSNIGDIFIALIKQYISMQRIRLLEPLFGHYSTLAEYGPIIFPAQFPPTYYTLEQREMKRRELMGITVASEKLLGTRSWDDNFIEDTFLIDFPALYQDIPPAFPGVRSMIGLVGGTVDKPSNLTQLLAGTPNSVGHQMKKHLEYVLGVCNAQKRLFVTSSARLGLGPQDMRQGDEIWIVESGAMPLVLRPAGTTREYLLIGEAYIHGIMHGEAVSEGGVEDIFFV
ncbi:hypothetical protein jhhlp_007734 [Lomentospora prolificans]|uniref:Heterokaryon incompatibility domain-containing protein n=1 Tax=Lomentospora prolificans TaxID=41688 RepID=A0A2N3N0F1_9PEZI|nr:hypothetical protein jhhlp_007734 [Lomentospora prolificans]